MLFIIEIIAGLFLLGVVAVAVFIMMQPKHRFVFDVKNRTKAELTDKTDNKLCFSVDVPFTNEGGDEGLVLDAFMRIYLPCLTLLCVFTCRRNSTTKHWCAAKLI